MRRLASALALVFLLGASSQGSSDLVGTSKYDGKPLRVLVVKSEHRTFLFNDAGRCVASFPDGIGAPWSPTPTGLFRVRQVIGKADAYADARSAYGNPYVYGPRIIDLGPNPYRRGFDEALHGTNQPDSIGHDVSEGCVRHRNPDIVTISRYVKAGDRVAIVERRSNRHLSR